MPGYHFSKPDTGHISESFTIDYQSVDDDPPTDNQVLGVIQYGETTTIDSSGPVKIEVGLPHIGNRRYSEIWTSNEDVTQDNYNDIYYSLNRHAIFGHLLIDENDFPNLEKATYFAYRKIIDLLDQQGYSHLLRVWNYFPDINKTVDSIERYRQFCIGRYNALKVSSETEKSLPAASAIGTGSPGLLVNFIASRTPGTQVENPKQTSAFHYPPEYGPKSPSFSRAVLKQWNKHAHLYISGTASILGHATTHINDVTSQFKQALENIEILLGRTDLQRISSDNPSKLSSISDISLWKIYIRHPEDIDKIQPIALKALGRNAPVMFLQGDICRSELLIEVEGICR